MFSALSECIQNIIPSLFPSLVLTSFLSQIGIPKTIRKYLSVATKKLTAIPPECTEILLFGLTSGYPTGVKIAKMYADKKITDLKSAKRAALLSTSPGLVYTVIAVGKMQFGSSTIGIFIYACILFSQILLSFITKKHIENSNLQQVNKSSDTTLSEIFCCSVSGASDACISLAAWISLFGALSELVKQFPLHSVRKIFDLTLEVTGAVRKSVAEMSIEKCTFSLGFGGLCILLQLLPDLIQLKVRAWEYLSVRLFIGLFSALLVKIFRFVLPPSVVPTFASGANIAISSNALPGFFSLLFLCVIFMYSIANPLYMC